MTSETKRLTIGFVGLGVQGKHLALNLRAAGHDVMAFDLRSEPLAELAKAGAAIAASTAQVGAFGEIVVVCVRDDDQTRNAVLSPNGVLAGMKPGTLLIVHSTVSPALIKELHSAARKVGVDLVDAPVSGGERGAIARTMAYMVGGSKESVARCAPVFAASGNKVTHTGDVGTAAQAKIVHQLIVCVNMLAASEGMRLGLAAGLSPEILTKIVREGAAQSRMADNWFSLSLRPHAVGVFDKDLSLCLAFADELGIAAPGAALAKRKIDEIVP